MDWQKYSFVVRGKNRKAILSRLDKPKTPTQLSDELKLSLPHVSRTLKEMEEAGIIECLTPDEKVGRVYRRASLGEEIANFIKSE